MNPTIPEFYPPGTFTAPGNPCVTCQHHFEVTAKQWPQLVTLVQAASLHLCLRHGLRCHPVSGHVLTPDAQHHCDTQRRGSAYALDKDLHCGPEGRYWQPQDPAGKPAFNSGKPEDRNEPV